jgi:hypothetical protein
MFRIFGHSKLLTAIKYLVILTALVLAIILSLLIVKKNDPKIPQKEVTIHLKLDDKLKICLPADE